MMAHFRLRFSFSELGRGTLLSHLEVQRALARLVRRADLPFVLTQGFSPRMKLATGPALPGGGGSLAEYADIELQRFIKPAEALSRLQAVAPPLLPVLDCAYCNPRDPSLDAWLDGQTIELRCDQALMPGCSAEDLARDFEAVRTGPEIEVVRKGKARQYLPTDFVPTPVEVREECAGSGPDGRATWVMRFEMRLPATGALRSDVFVAALLRPYGLAPTEVTITRVALFHEAAGKRPRQFALPPVREVSEVRDGS